MVLISTSTAPTTYGLAGDGGIPTANNVTLTYPMAAAASITEGDFVKLNSTLTGDIIKCTDTADNAIGIAAMTQDNSSGVSGDKFCTVMRKGFAYATAALVSSGTVAGKDIHMDELLYLSKTASYNPYEGQTLTSTNGGTLVARSLDQVTKPTTTGTTTYAKIRIYLDRLSKSTLVA